MKSIFWFRRDLRLRDNKALHVAASRAGELAAFYVLDTEELRDIEAGPADPRFHFLLDALYSLSRKVRLHVAYGKTAEAFAEVLDANRVEAVYTSAPLTWSEEMRVREVRKVCEERGVRLYEVLDNVLADPRAAQSVRTFTSFYREWLGRVDARDYGEVPGQRFAEIDAPSLEELASKYAWRVPERLVWSAGWLEERLRTYDFGRYAAERDYPYLDGSSRLSPYIRHGLVSVRELYRIAAGTSREFVRQLAWREYYYALRFKYPWMRDLELKPQMRNLEWENDPYLIEEFENGRTGYPIVDAGIRQLKSEYWVHNRVRMILASFLTKDLLVDWRIGERLFKRYLIDYDEPLNVGNWQWSASVGVDPLPLRIFNPSTQAQKYDPDCLYIKRYIPELEGYSCRELQDPYGRGIVGYYAPIVDHRERVKKLRHLVSTRIRGTA